MTWFVKDSKILDFLSKLAKDSDLLEQYREDPEGVMDEAGLSEEEKTILMSKRPGDIIAAFTDHLFKV